MANTPRSGHKSRRRRKLPDMHHVDSADAAVFWYSYQSALTWIRGHEHIISKCLQLLQIYPNLVKDQSLDPLWDFIESLLHVDHPNEVNDTKNSEVIRHKRQGHHSSRKVRGKVDNLKGPEIPQISVTETSNPPGPSFLISAQHARTPRVHLISRSGGDDKGSSDRLLHAGVLDMLQEDFYIRVTNNKHQTCHAIRKDSKRQFIVAESDVCVYLFNDSTLEDAACFHDLCVALAQNIPVVYIRYHKQQLPKTFPDTVNSISKGCLTLKDYMHKFVPETHSSSSDSLSVKANRVKKRLTPLNGGHRSKSSSEINVTGLEKHGRPSSSLDIDLVLTLVSNFKNACVFDETDVDGCCARFKQKIHKVLGICESWEEVHSFNNNTSEIHRIYNDHSDDITGIGNSKNTSTNSKHDPCSESLASPGNDRQRFLSVPDPQDMISTREWGSSVSVSVPPPEKSNHDDSSEGEEDSILSLDSDSRMVCSPVLEQKASTYLIFNHNNLLEGPRKIEFPSESDNIILEDHVDSDEDCTANSESPINFHEIDLSREINPRGTPESDTSSVY